MLGLLKKKNPYAQNARDVYAQLLVHVRDLAFYERFAVPDSFDGRFDLLVVHAFMVIESCDDAAFGQALFDAVFADMDQTLREMGVGDVGVPKHMRKMMKAFNGRMHAYSDALEGGDIEGALVRNLYGTVNAPDAKAVKGFTAYMRKNLKALNKAGIDKILSGEALFKI